jgi:hypothetical protein
MGYLETGRIRGKAEAVLATLAGLRAGSNLIAGDYYRTAGDALVTIALAYEARQLVTEGLPNGKGHLVAGICLTASGIEKTVSGISEYKPIQVVNGALDLMIGGVMFIEYIYDRKILRKHKQLEEAQALMAERMGEHPGIWN